MEAKNDEQLLDIVVCNGMRLNRFSNKSLCTFYTLILEDTAVLSHLQSTSFPHCGMPQKM